MYQAFCNALGPSVGVKPVPLTSFGRKFARRTSVSLLVVGGGTLLGRPEWHRRIAAAISTLRPNRVVAFGTGVLPLESPTGEDLLSYRDADCLKSLLADFDSISVRGPRSVRSLQALGVDSRSVGDLALLNLPVRAPGPTTPSNGRVLVNFADTPDRLRDVHATSARAAILEAGSRLRARGFRFEAFAMEPDDFSLLSRYSAEFDRVHPYSPNPERLLNAMRNSALVVSERLHGSILAASQRIPFLAVPYKSKVGDFAESIGAEEFILDPVYLSDPGSLVELFIGVPESPSWYRVWGNVSKTSADARRELISLVKGV
ncbi:polysaccharide pyruvyl transferase family protein [Dietzia maris]|uniref:polysaccharide pyruvyl transferase family protein n=1 Tax=Dietzia maris TaxID=37915 RepID=UPI003B42F112